MKESFERKYFAASNSTCGFVHYYSEIFSPERCDRLYVVKGGPGTGKSHFMRQVANVANRRGEQVTYYYCSSDPTSLDGIFLEKSRIGMIDGTAPHVYEPTAVGAFEQIVNLGAFWNERALYARRGEIERLAVQKKQAFSSVYAYLAAIGEIDKAISPALLSCVKWEKLAKKVERQMSFFATERAPKAEIALCGSLGMQGIVYFDTYQKRAKNLYLVGDFASIGTLYLEKMLQCCQKKGISVRYAPNPLFPQRIDAVELLQSGTVFMIAPKGEGADINIKRFLDEKAFSTVRGRVRQGEKLKNQLLEEIGRSFEMVKETHFALEGIFGQSMDFTAKEAFAEQFCERLL